MKKYRLWQITQSIIIATLITSFFACCVVGVFARYITEKSGILTGIVAKFDVSANFTGTNTNFSLLEGTNTATASYSFSVTSDSEVAVSYDVILTLPSVLPNGVTFKINGVDPIIDTEGLIYTFSEVGTFTASGGTNSHMLTITATDFSVEAAINNIKVEIIVSQIQSN